MKAILADINVQGQVAILQLLLEGEPWRLFWDYLKLEVLTFAEVGLAADAADVLVWQTCQDRAFILITGNRNEDGPDSLETTIRERNHAGSLPVFTIADTEAVRHSRVYAEQVVDRLLQYLLEIDMYRGTGRLYLP
jgi:hypothetical protein